MATINDNFPDQTKADQNAMQNAAGGTGDVAAADAATLSVDPAFTGDQNLEVLALFSDGDRVVFDWGDGSTNTVNSANGRAQAAHYYGDDGIYDLVITSRQGEAGITSTENRTVVVATTPGGLERASLPVDGNPTDGDSFGQTTSADGRYVAFVSEASNLVAGDTNGLSDTFLRDTQNGTTIRVSTASDGAEGNGASDAVSVSADGRYVAFQSTASNLVADDTNSACDIFLRDTQTGITTRISDATDGTPGNDGSFNPYISGDGRYVAFFSAASNLVAGDTNGSYDVFLRDTQTGITTRVSTAFDGSQGNNSSHSASVSADGRYVAFISAASNLTPGDANGATDIFLRDMQNGTTTLVSLSTDGVQSTGWNEAPSISANGRYVAFQSPAGNLVANDTNGFYDIFLRDTQAGTTTLISLASDGAQGNGSSLAPTVSADGRYVAFHSNASNLVAGDTNGESDIFVYDTATGLIRLVSGINGDVQNGASVYGRISADGHSIAFSTTDDAMDGPGQDNFSDVLVWRDASSLFHVIAGTTEGGDIVQGSAAADSVSLGGGDDRAWLGQGSDDVQGGAGDDIIDGGQGADAMTGGVGNDTYYVDDIGDTTIEGAGEGTDLVIASISITLAAEVENLTLVGGEISGTGNSGDNTIKGNDAANTLSGLGGDDVLRGGGGADTMAGGAGDDRYYVDDAGDTITEPADGGNDIVIATVSYTLAARVDNLTLDGAAASGTGNVVDNTIRGNELDNTLSGLGGDDSLLGYGGDDTLDGGSGADTLNGGIGADAMAGGSGNDRYYVDDIADSVSEVPGEGSDLVMASVSYTLSDAVENLNLVGSAASGTGNDGANTIRGNALDNMLSGLGGRDTLLGDDGDDILSGGAGVDRLTGGAGSDTFVFDTLGDGYDRINDWEAGDRLQIDRAAFGLGLTDPVDVVTGTSARGLSDDLVFYQSSTGRLFWHDGDTNALTQFAALATKPASIEVGDVLFV